MTSRERVTAVLQQKPVDRLPRQLWLLPGVWMNQMEDVEYIRQAYPGDFGRPRFTYGEGRRCRGRMYNIGSATDAWGSVWHAAEQGVVGEVKEYPLWDWDALKSYELPWELLDEADFSQVNASCAESDLFMLVGTETRPFERMQFLRGTENLLLDLAYGEREVYELRDKLHAFFAREMEMWAKTDVDGVTFMDDWGSQTSLLISPAMWREFFKPLYRDYCEILHSHGKYVFFHSDGCIEAIYPDLIEIGIDAVNSQLFCMDIEGIGEKYAGKIAFWGEIDRQHVLPFGTPDNVRAAVDRAASALLKNGRTGVIAQFEWGVGIPRENAEAVFQAWNAY